MLSKFKQPGCPAFGASSNYAVRLQQGLGKSLHVENSEAHFAFTGMLESGCIPCFRDVAFRRSSQRLQYPLLKGYTVNHIKDPTII